MLKQTEPPKREPPPKKAAKPEKPRPYKRGTGLRIGLAALGFAAALIIGFRIVNSQRAREANELAETTRGDAAAAPLVDVISAKAAPATQTLTLPGETAAWYDSRIYARVNGYVAKWSVDIGDSVKTGQTLALIDTPELDAELLASRAKLLAARAQVQVKQADADFAKSTFDRWRNSPQGVVSEQERESKKAAFVAANAQLVAAKAQISLNQADIDRLTALTQFKEVKAPFDGTIVHRDIDVGNLVTAGSTASTSELYRISLDQPMRVFAHVPQSAAVDLLKGGVTAVVTLSDGSGRRYEGKVTRTSKAINTQSRTLRVEVDLPNKDGALVPGMYVQVAFAIANDIGVQIPAAALLFRPGPKVAVVSDKDVVEFRDVKIGIDDGNTVQIATGLKEGERVVLNISSQVASGEKVDAHDVGLKGSGKIAGK